MQVHWCFRVTSCLHHLGNREFLWNASTFLLSYMVSHPRRQQSWHYYTFLIKKGLIVTLNSKCQKKYETTVHTPTKGGGSLVTQAYIHTRAFIITYSQYAHMSGRHPSGTSSHCISHTWVAWSHFSCSILLFLIMLTNPQITAINKNILWQTIHTVSWFKL